MEIIISEINTSQFNPFAATDEELVANAMDQAGILTKNTRINGKLASDLCHNYYEKRENYKKSTQLGNLLVKDSIISHSQLKEALEYQKKQPYKKLGDTLVELNYCTKEEISGQLKNQSTVRSNLKDLDLITGNVSYLNKDIRHCS